MRVNITTSIASGMLLLIIWAGNRAGPAVFRVAYSAGPAVLQEAYFLGAGDELLVSTLLCASRQGAARQPSDASVLHARRLAHEHARELPTHRRWEGKQGRGRANGMEGGKEKWDTAWTEAAA